MKTKIHFPLILLLILICCVLSGSAQAPPQLFGFNEKDAQLITIRNSSGDSANDFHLKVKVPLPGMGGTPIIKRVVFVPGAAGQNGAFKDTLFSSQNPYPSACDWSAAENNFMVPPGQAFRIQLWGNRYDKDSTYLTRNGTPLSTNGLKARLEINKSGGGAGSMKIVNEEGAGILLQNLELHINNTNFPFDSLNYSPTGTLVSGIPNSMLINPGDSIEYPYIGNLPGNWITLHCIAALTTSPSEYYESGAAANDVIQSAVPTLSEWGLITLAALFLSIGIFYVKDSMS